ncbi:MAG: bifunctional metallophosphatase/5'-nucleotidase [Calditrichaeota bacterium]|nr:bifunctional metallophosphatase/5'-nucleotidase [Calditrichota bacterium]MCB9366281.1 bifunctional metallophosphatase/5'-nucleotidase [Calditrichota bacterium]
MNRTIFAALTALVVIGCASTRTLTILHTNDIHGRFAAEQASWRADSAEVGGFAALSGALDSVRRADAATIYLDAGDLMTGNPICNIKVEGLEGGALLHLLKLCRCDAGCLGNHEFDLGSEHVQRFAATSEVDLLCANVTKNETGNTLCSAHKIVERGGMRIGVIGLLLNDLAGVTSKRALEPFTVRDIAQTAQTEIEDLDSETDLIILLTHNGVESDKLLARELHSCDIIVGGHSHTRLQEPLLENGILIVQAGSYLKNLGVLKVKVRKDKVVSYDGELVELVDSRFEPLEDVESYASKFKADIDREYGMVIAAASETLERRFAESSPLGNLICDLMRDSYRTDFALTNSGGLRKDIACGPVRKLDCLELMPFVNSVTLFTATGAELRTIAARQVSAQLAGTEEILQMSGLTISYDVVDGAAEDLEVKVNAVPVEDERTYRGVSIDYVLAAQPEAYLGLTPRDVEGTGTLFSDFLMDAFARAPQPLVGVNEARLYQRNK